MRMELPNRRHGLTTKVEWVTETGHHSFHMSIGFHPQTGALCEVFFADGMKSGSDLLNTVQDACVLISLLLQHGVPIFEIAKSLGQTEVLGETVPATVIGAMLQKIEQVVA